MSRWGRERKSGFMKEIAAAAEWIAAQNGLVERVGIFGEDYPPYYRLPAFVRCPRFVSRS